MKFSDSPSLFMTFNELLPVEVDPVCHVVDVFQDFVEAELVLDDTLLCRFHQCDADDLDKNI
jgi:hypothetical protein